MNATKKAPGILAKIEAALTPRKREPIFAIAEKVYAHDPTAAPTESELKKLRALQSEWQNFWRAANHDFTYAAAQQQWKREQAGVAANIAKGEPADDTGFQNLVTQFESRQYTCKAEMFRVCREAEPVCQPIVKRFLNAATRYRDAREKQEHDEADELGLEACPSALLFALRKIVARMENRARLGFEVNNCAHPAAQLFFVEQLQN